MNQRELSFLYRGVFLFVLAGLALTLLSSIEKPWAQHIRDIGNIALFVGGAAFIAFTAVRGFREFLNVPIPDEPLPPSVYSPHLRRTARIAIVAALLLFATLVAVLLFGEPPKQCPNWHLPDQRATSLWLPVLWSALLLAMLIFTVMRWSWLIEKAIWTVNYPMTMPVAYVLVMTVLIGCAMSQFPLLLLVTRCWLQP